MKRSNHSEHFFTADEQTQIEAAIAKAEQSTSAEIKLAVLRHCWQDIRVKAVELFKKYELYKTQDRNAVLILLVTTNREFVIYGDEGIHQKVGQAFWEDVKEVMSSHFRNDAFGEGMEAGIRRIGQKLEHYFPCRANDINEIGNEVAYEE